MARLLNHQLRIIMDDFVYVEEGRTGLPVAENIDAVVRALQRNWHLGERRIFYRDTYGDIDEIILCNGAFERYQRADDIIIKKINNLMKRVKK
jgi:hypothetical protein